MTQFDDHIRVLMYSHDTFGLGHLRRTRTIAHALVEQHKQLSVLIISGSSIAGAFDFRARVDFIKIPSVIKLRNGDYTSLSDHIDLSETLVHAPRDHRERCRSTSGPTSSSSTRNRAGLQRRTRSDAAAPARKWAARLVLGLREVLDEPNVVRDEWARADAVHSVMPLLRPDLGLRLQGLLRSSQRRAAAGRGQRSASSTSASSRAPCPSTPIIPAHAIFRRNSSW